ncbi:type VI secretion system protein TssL, long form [Xanthobacteraceae bacterium A53D]
MSTSTRAIVAPTVLRHSAEGARRSALAGDLAEHFEQATKPAAAAPAMPPEAETLLSEFRFEGGQMPALVAGAVGLLALAHGLRGVADGVDMDALRHNVVRATRDYERDLAGARIAPERARAAHYVVCAMIDDVILAQPWGVRGGWAKSGLVSTFHMDVTGGERVFELLDHFHRNPGANKDLLLLIYLALSLGFEGRTRVSPRGTLELMHIRDGLYRTLKGQFGEPERELSPHWRGVNARHKPLRNAATLWAIAGLLVLLLALGYLAFTLLLNRNSDQVLAGFATAVPATNPSLAGRPKPVEPPEQETVVSAPVTPDVPPPKVEPKPEPLENLFSFLQPEVDENLVTLSRQNNAVLVRIRNAGLFDTGRAEIKPDFHNLLNRIGTALAADNLKAVVIGHSDNVPIRTAQYPSNWHLSEARARAVAAILTGYTGPDAVTYEGRAETEPVADNATEAGREANRRTEILVLGAGAQVHRNRPPAADAAPGQGR